METRRFCTATLGFLFFVLFLMAPGCSTKKPTGAKGEPAAASDESCLLGKWVATEGTIEKSFTFNADKTGQEVQSPSDIRPLNWSKNGRKLHIIYLPHGDTVKSEWDLDYKCSEKELRVLGLTYKKQ